MSLRFKPTTDRERQTGRPDFGRVMTDERRERAEQARLSDAKMRFIEAKVGSEFQLPVEVMDNIKRSLPTRNPHGLMFRRAEEDRQLQEFQVAGGN